MHRKECMQVFMVCPALELCRCLQPSPTSCAGPFGRAPLNDGTHMHGRASQSTHRSPNTNGVSRGRAALEGLFADGLGQAPPQGRVQSQPSSRVRLSECGGTSGRERVCSAPPFQGLTKRSSTRRGSRLFGGRACRVNATGKQSGWECFKGVSKAARWLATSYTRFVS